MDRTLDLDNQHFLSENIFEQEKEISARFRGRTLVYQIKKSLVISPVKKYIKLLLHS